MESNPKYFEGTPCAKCGGTARYISAPSNCVRCIKERSLAKNKAEYAADPERQRRRSAKYRAENRDKERARYQAWLDKNPEKRRASAKANYDRRRHAEGGISQAEVQELFRDQDGKCAYFDLCATHLGMNFRCDHIVPVVAGGPHYAWNRQLLCDPCNLKKKNADPVKFARENGLDSFRALRAVSMMGQFSPR